MLFLIMAIDKTNKGTVEDDRTCFRRGDIVRTMPDSAHDGNITANPICEEHFLLRVTGISEEQAIILCQEETDISGEITRVRSIGMNMTAFFATLSPLIRQRVQFQDRYYEVAFDDIRGFLRHKLNGLGI